MRKTLLLIATLTILMVLVPAHTACAQDGLTIQTRAGFDGFFKLNGWVPVYVVAENKGEDIDGEIQVQTTGNMGNRVLYTQPAILPTQSRKQFTLYVYVANYARDLTVQLVQRNKTVVEQKVQIEPLDEQQFLVGVLSDDVAALNYLAGLSPIGKGRYHIAHLGLSDLPAQGYALSGLDALIVHNVDTAQLTEAQRNALRGWIAFGGHLIVTGGPNALATAAGLDTLLPVKITGSQTADLSALGKFASVSLDAKQTAVVAQVEPVDAQILAGDAALPLLVRREADRGRIDYLAPDPDLEPLRTWIGNDQFWPHLFFSTPLSTRSGLLGSTGWNLNYALSNIPSLDLPSVLLVMAFLFAYILVVGPLNLLILRLVDKQALGWVTVPTLIVLFSCVAYVFGFVSRGRKVIISEISVVRAQPSSQVAAIDSFIGIYSPIRRGYDVQVPDYRLVSHLDTQSYGAPTLAPDELKVEQGPPTYLRDLDINVGAMQGFATHSIDPWPSVAASLTLSQPNANTYHIEGQITNQSDARIVNSVLVLNMQFYHLGDLAAGETKSLSFNIQRTSNANIEPIVQKLTGPTGIGKAGREAERKSTIVSNLLSPYYYGSSRPIRLEGLNLIGWLDKSPGEIRIPDATVEHVQTTLLVVQLPVTSADENQVVVPKGFMAWQVVEGDSAATPRMVYNYQPTATFKFFIPNAQGMTIKTLTLHVDSTESQPYGNPPTVEIKNVETGKWETFNKLAWGETVLSDPNRFIDGDGSIQVRVSSNTIQSTVSIDFSAVGIKK